MSNQIHEYHAQIPGSDVFWTVPVSSSSVTVRLFGTTKLQLTNFAAADFHDNVNGLGQGSDFPGNGIPATLTLTVQWNPITRPRNTAGDFGGFFVGGINASIQWSAAQSGFVVASDSGAIARDVRSVLLDFDPTIPNNYAAVGRERNGSFFR
jgi:hypothetical protein